MKKLLSALALLLAGAHAVADTGAAPLAIAPSTGDTGYDEIKLSANTWYVAFFGSRQTAPASVETAWKARVATLCAQQEAPFFVELRYVAEPVLASDKVALAGADELGALLRPAGAVYIPIYTPRSAPVTVTTPAKMAPALCVAEPAALRDPARAEDARAVLEKARKDGYTFQ
jgi:hypothetical protein